MYNILIFYFLFSVWSFVIKMMKSGVFYGTIYSTIIGKIKLLKSSLGKKSVDRVTTPWHQPKKAG